MRRLLPLVPLLVACGSDVPPPGELIGTFAFEATLDRGGDETLCRYDGLPEKLSFDGVLSWDRETSELWLQIDGVVREGHIDGAAFAAILPDPEGEGPRQVPRKLRGCTCDMTMAERISGRVVRDPAIDCASIALDPIDTVCPRLDEQGEIDWASCGGVCGTLEETVTAHLPCTCTVDDAEVSASQTCLIRYRLEAERVGGNQ